ncbi:hypothetical protein [Agromyces salentinus]|uniref:hypothetical protein n=1 Tax=Agromyces salentinus TaxID=269421 RepID=UPI0012F8B304|nr:hypothetical protein [Agromyces salentinus]
MDLDAVIAEISELATDDVAARDDPLGPLERAADEFLDLCRFEQVALGSDRFAGRSCLKLFALLGLGRRRGIAWAHLAASCEQDDDDAGDGRPNGPREVPA